MFRVQAPNTHFLLNPFTLPFPLLPLYEVPNRVGGGLSGERRKEGYGKQEGKEEKGRDGVMEGGKGGVTPFPYHPLSPVRVNNEPHLIMVMRQLGSTRARANKIGFMTRCYEDAGALRQYWMPSTLTPDGGKEGKGGTGGIEESREAEGGNV